MSSTQPLPLPDDPHPHIVGVQVGEVIAYEPLQQAHQVGDLGGGRRRFSREAVDRQIPDAEVDRRAHGPADRLYAAPVAFEARKTPWAAHRPLPSMMIATCAGEPSLAPATGRTVDDRLASPLMGFSLMRGRPQTCMISLSFAASRRVDPETS